MLACMIVEAHGFDRRSVERSCGFRPFVSTQLNPIESDFIGDGADVLRCLVDENADNLDLATMCRLAKRCDNALCRWDIDNATAWGEHEADQIGSRLGCDQGIFNPADSADFDD